MDSLLHEMLSESCKGRAWVVCLRDRTIAPPVCEGYHDVRILFVHQNFPGQFGHLAAALGARGHAILVLTDALNKQAISHDVCRYDFVKRDPPPKSIGLAGGITPQLDRGEAAARAAESLRAKHNYAPDLIIANPGWGEAGFLKHVWPDARMLVYAEFCYRARGLDTDFDPELQKPRLGSDMWVSTRRLPLLQAIDIADHAVSPTHWQASTFPQPYRERISVIHDGIDTRRLRPVNNASVEFPGTKLRFRKGDELLTFVNRNLEPFRGYHTFMRALPAVLAARPNAQVVIVGRDDVSYGTAPPPGTTWQKVFFDEVADRIDKSRVHFVGRIPYPTFVDLMKVSRVHAYLTYPFVLSWSMLEAMSAGALVIGSATPPVAEVIRDGENGRLVDFFDIAAWSAAIIEGLAEPQRFMPLRHAARETILRDYDLATECLPAMVALVERVGGAPLRGSA
jgi:glycosyltransferase involved in cell wall biosynthesis